MSNRERVILLVDQDEEPTQVGPAPTPAPPTRAPALPPPLPPSVRRLSPREVRDLTHVLRVALADRIDYGHRLATIERDLRAATVGAVPR